MSLPRIAITTGDPAGIGPEIAERAAADSRVRAVCVPLIYGAEKRFTPGQLSAAAGQARDRAATARGRVWVEPGSPSGSAVRRVVGLRRHELSRPIAGPLDVRVVGLHVAIELARQLLVVGGFDSGAADVAVDDSQFRPPPLLPPAG